MDPTEARLLERALTRYERSRLKTALLAAAPSLLLPLIAFVVGGRLAPSIGLGLVLWAGIVALAWRGQAWGLSVSVGLKAGAVPLVLALAAQRIGHVCTPNGCTSLCVPMCTAGGLAAGLIIAAAARRSSAPVITAGSGAALSLAVGALGCSCVGAAGMVGMALGLAGAGFGSLMIRRIRNSE